MGRQQDRQGGRIEARGFILAGRWRIRFCRFVPIRKKGKLPHTTVRIAYSLEYGIDEMEMHADAIRPGERVILVDDLIATGGTAEGAVKLMRQIGAMWSRPASSSTCRSWRCGEIARDGCAGANPDGVRGH